MPFSLLFYLFICLIAEKASQYCFSFRYGFHSVPQASLEYSHPASVSLQMLGFLGSHHF